MTKTPPELLLARLDDIGAALLQSGHALALIGLGSVGLERHRLDRYSDLDFFVVVEPGHKSRYIDCLDWLEAAHPLAWHFRNTVDGHKALSTDGVFCEFAVFEPDELAAIPFAPGRIIWRRPGVDESIAVPVRPLPETRPAGIEWIVGEALSCLYVGMQRWLRGEKLSAARFVQGHALDRLIELDDSLAAGADADADAGVDPFVRERRLEQRRPELARELPQLAPGYLATPQAALAMLAALERRGVAVDAAMKEHIGRLVEAAAAASAMACHWSDGRLDNLSPGLAEHP